MLLCLGRQGLARPMQRSPHESNNKPTRLAAHIGTACYTTTHTETFTHPELLRDAVDMTFKRLHEINARIAAD